MTMPRNQLSQAVQAALLLALLPMAAVAQTTTDKPKTLGTIEVTGTRIKQTDAVTASPVAIISRAQIDKSGAASIGEFLQQLTSSGKALNAKFNSSGNFGYPPDGGGIGAGSSQVDLRNLGSQRVLVLVDGIRWVNESSASGVSGSADLNTIPLDIVERIEVLEDGASAIYGSDAIAGVVNIITRKNFDGASVHTKYGQYSGFGGDTKEASVTIGGSADKVSGVFSASYFDQQSISSGDWAQSSFAPIGRAGRRHGSSATPQGRFTFCDPRISDPNQYGFCDAAGNMWFDIALNNGTTTPNYNGGDPTGPGGTYHDFSGADRFAYAPYNLLLTPQTRKSLFGSIQYDINDKTTLHAKALYNTRESTNQAAPEPIFVGPFAGTGGIADTIVISHLNPYNPFGIDLDPATNFGWVTKRPIELAPRIFTQSVDTSYFNLGLDGSFNNGFSWDMNYVHSENKATQTFYNGFNVGKLKIALGDPAVCAATPGCVPLDLFGGESRPITAAMFGYITTTQIDSSKQVLDLFSSNLTGDLWAMGGDRNAAFATGVEYRRYQGEFNPDPLRQTGESQDSFAAPVSASYSVKEFYGEVQLPWADSFSTDLALRYSDYSTFGSATTGKAGFRWQPVEDLVIRGTYSTGFRAPNIGELYGLTQFGATLTDPCSNYAASGNATLISRCQALGVPSGYEQANTQITTFTGGNPALDPEKSDNYNVGAVWSPGWAEDLSWSKRMDFEFDYYNYKVKKAIQAPDIQALLDGCVIGSITGAACSGFTRQSSGNLNPPTDFLSNLGTIKTSGIDLKANWMSPEFSWGTLSGTLQSTHTINYSAVDAFGNVAQRAVGIEVDNSAIPSWQTNVQFGWTHGDWAANWTVRYISKVIERCSDFRDGRSDSLTNLGLCSLPDTTDNSKSLNELDATVYNDAQLSWKNAFTLEGVQLSLGVNNLFDKDPPECTSCTLNGYDAGTYDLPGRFWYVSLDYKF